MEDIRVALVDGHVMMREALAAQLDLVDGIRIVWQGTDEAALLAHYAANLPDRPQVVIIAVWVQGIIGVSTVKRLKKLNEGVRVIGLTLVHDMEIIRRLMEVGAYGCVHKSQTLPVLVDLIRAAWNGPEPSDPATRDALDEYLKKRRNWPTESGFPAADKTKQIYLTPREHDVLRFVCNACDNRTIGKHLGISKRTVQSHLTHIYEKLQVQGRMEAIIVAIRDRWVVPDYLGPIQEGSLGLPVAEG